MTTQLSLGGADGSRLVLPVIPPRGAPRARVRCAPEASTEAAGVRSTGGAWPGQWTICRDEIRQAAHGDWSGTSSTQYPWGTVASSEQMTYDVADAHPESARTAGDAETTITLPDRKLSWKVAPRGHERRDELLTTSCNARAAKGRRAHPREGVG